MTKGKIELKIGLFSILAFLFTSLGCSDSGENPDFSFPSELTDIAGQQFDPQSLEGKPIVINFFASWCDPCKREMSEIERINSRSYKPELASLIIVLVRIPITAKTKTKPSDSVNDTLSPVKTPACSLSPLFVSRPKKYDK